MRKLWNFFKKTVLVLVALYLFAVFTDLRILSGTGSYGKKGSYQTITYVIWCDYWGIRPFWVDNLSYKGKIHKPRLYLVDSHQGSPPEYDSLHFWDRVCPNFYFQPNPLKAGDAVFPLKH